MKLTLLLILSGLMTICQSKAQFVDKFDGNLKEHRGETPPGWSVASGDGNVSISFIQQEGFASILVDASQDKRNIWWAIIRGQVSGLDMKKLIDPENELRVEARIKVSHAPRRVNLHFNHQRTTDFHSHLMEYDIPDTNGWHIISMTTRDFNVLEDDKINVQMALMDWGLGKYRVDVDDLSVDVVNKNMVNQDSPNKLPYHPAVPDPEVFEKHLSVNQDAIIDLEYPDMNFNNWKTLNDTEEVTLLTVSSSQVVLLRWDLGDLKGKNIKGSGLLELTSYAIQRSPEYEKDFGMVRITEILDGDENWDQGKVTYHSFCSDLPFERVLNQQMVIDYPVAEQRGQKTLFTISEPVLQRLLDGTTKGLAIRPLGAVVASFYSMEYKGGKYAPVLHFNAE